MAQFFDRIIRSHRLFHVYFILICSTQATRTLIVVGSFIVNLLPRLDRYRTRTKAHEHAGQTRHTRQTC